MGLAELSDRQAVAGPLDHDGSSAVTTTGVLHVGGLQYTSEKAV